ncbi:glycine-rich domain-containing protein [Streptomyces sp. NPDC086023]|uniref:glycine-rich domain-containing protein n=1 Tax=Streptomyces sp. NPDC086023 TaxID=3365746 RepID=UPI0037D82437
MSTTTTATTTSLDARRLISPAEFEGVVATVLDNNEGMAPADAERITEEAIKFVATAARGRGGMRPSRTVDEGWHALILHTRVYAALCRRVGRFVHHIPERPDPTRHDPSALEATQARITAAGYEVDRTLWLGPSNGSVPVAAGCEHTSCGDSNCEANCSETHPN